MPVSSEDLRASQQAGSGKLHGILRNASITECADKKDGKEMAEYKDDKRVEYCMWRVIVEHVLSPEAET